MNISSAGSRSRLLIVITGIDIKISHRNKQTNKQKTSASRGFQQTPIKHLRIVIANVGLLLLEGIHKLDQRWGHIVSYVAHQYSRVGFDSSVEVNSLYYGGVGCNHTSLEWIRAVRHIYGIIRHMQASIGKIHPVVPSLSIQFWAIDRARGYD